jgi:hypothetical protein
MLSAAPTVGSDLSRSAPRVFVEFLLWDSAQRGREGTAPGWSIPGVPSRTASEPFTSESKLSSLSARILRRVAGTHCSGLRFTVRFQVYGFHSEI